MQHEEFPSETSGPDDAGRRALMQGGLIVAGGFIVGCSAAAESLATPAHNPTTQ